MKRTTVIILTNLLLNLTMVNSAIARHDVKQVSSCFHKGYDVGVEFYNTKNEKLKNVGLHPCCRDGKSIQCSSYMAGFGCVLQNGTEKGDTYRDLEHYFKLVELGVL